jgi:pSer/pThr/pTyr-binding forkhead associated (FHA) protein
MTIKFKTGALSGKTFSLGPGEYMFIGTGENCAIKITDDPTVDATHAAIYFEPSGRILFKDMGSKAGTFLNGKKLSKQVVLKPGQRVTIGRVSTFQSSWWNALQATKMTRFTGLAPRDVVAAPTPESDSRAFKLRLFSIAVAIIFIFVGGQLLWNLLSNQEKYNQVVEFDEGDSNSATKNQATTSVKSEFSLGRLFSAKAFTNKQKKPPRSRIEITPQMQFIWDEIVAISRRFGDPPPSAMDPGFVREVERHIQKFLKHDQHQILLERMAEYRPTIEATLRKNGLPIELGYIVWVESNYKVDAKSPVGAAGLWQFMPETAQEYGLKVSAKVDDRYDLQKSTQAAAQYFTSLLRMFGTERYLLAIASYNTGQNRVKRKQIATTVHKEHTSDFWQLRYSLPKETAEYVPKFIAAAIIARNPQRYKPNAH